jgi:hypothetical protein
MIPRRIEADRAKGADTEAAPFSSIVSMESFSHRANRPPSLSLSLSHSFLLFPFIPMPCTRVHGERIKKTRSQKVRGAPPLMNAATSWPPCFPSAGVCTPYSPKHPLCRVSLRVPTFQPLAKPRLNPCTSSAYTAYCGVQR